MVSTHEAMLLRLNEELGRKLLSTNGTECEVDSIIEKCIKKERDIQFAKRRSQFLKMFIQTVKTKAVSTDDLVILHKRLKSPSLSLRS